MTARDPDSTAGALVDRWTLVAITALAYVVANVAHEGVGHGGACALAGGDPRVWNAIYFDCDKTVMTGAGVRWLAAAGSLVNLAIAAVAFSALAATRGRGATTGRYFLWLLGTLDLFQATGYWLFSGVAGIGDWVVVVRGLEPAWLWRALLAVTGAAAYWAAVVFSLRRLAPFVGAGPERLARARTLTLLPYLSGGVLYVVAGLLNPLSFLLVLISAAAASFGGASGLAWMFTLFRHEERYPPSTEPPLRIARGLSWIVAGAAVALLFVFVLGPGITF